MAIKAKNEILLQQYIPLKRYSDDLPYDLKHIIESRLSRFKVYLDAIPLEQMKTAITDFKSMASEIVSCSDKTRLYIFNDFNRALFVSLDFPEKEATCLTENIENILMQCPETFKTEPEYVSTLYIFKRNTLAYSRDLYPPEVVDIISHYHLLDFLIHKAFD